MEKLNIHQIHERCLNIAVEFDRICTKHDIPYYMLGGTMLGAIRHKGFIPWDDDMDFGVPIEYYEKLIDLLQRELPSPLRCLTYRNSESVIFPFFKIDDSSTVISQMHTGIISKKNIGVNVDVFPLFCCGNNDVNAEKALQFKKMSAYIYLDTMHNSRMRRMLKKMLQTICPFSVSWFVNKTMQYADKIEEGDYLANIYGRWTIKETIPIEWYGNGKRFEFEGYSFVGIEQYDKYLTQLYTDYMRLPPESQRILHGGTVYSR